MSYIPDCRTDENYNQKYLNQKDKQILNGFDWAIEMAVDNFFNNLELLEDGYLEHILNDNVAKGPEGQQEEYKMEFTFGGREPETRKVDTFADLLRFKILEFCEMERDELITSMIDGMDESEYDSIKRSVDGQGEAENR